MSAAEKDAPEKSVQDFLQRWSRRKLGIAETDDVAAPNPAEPPQTGEAPLAEAAPEPATAFDVTALPPLESIGATTDIRGFLAPGVPVELARAALRRAWTSDPAIRDFVGIAENQWDFTNPDAISGLGSLQFSEEVRAMVSRLFGEELETGASSGNSERPKPQAATEMASVPPPAAGGSLQEQSVTNRAAVEEHAAAHKDARQGDSAPAQRSHGGAMPK